MKKTKNNIHAFSDDFYELAKNHEIKLNSQDAIENILLDVVLSLIKKQLNVKTDEHLSYEKMQLQTLLIQEMTIFQKM